MFNAGALPFAIFGLLIAVGTWIFRFSSTRAANRLFGLKEQRGMKIATPAAIAGIVFILTLVFVALFTPALNN